MLKEILADSGGVLLLISIFVQIAPIKLNPWSQIARFIGSALNVEVMEKLEVNEANNSRYRILRFDDEIRHKTKHTQEHFNQIIEEINTYEKYCEEHPKYKNMKAVSAIENIREVYNTCKKENSFLV